MDKRMGEWMNEWWKESTLKNNFRADVSSL